LPNTRSVAKAARQSLRKQARNRIIKSATRTRIKQARLALESQDLEQAQEAVKRAIVALDKAAEKGIIHKNNAARRKSRLMKQYNRMGAAE